MKNLSHFLLATLRGRLIVSVAVVHAVMMTLFIVDLTIRQRSMLLDRQIEEATALSQTLATSAAGWIAANDIAGLQEIVEAQRRYPELIFAMLVDEEGRVLASTKTSEMGQYVLDLPKKASQTILSGNPSLVDVVSPAMISRRHIGWARVGIGQAAAGKKLAEITRNGVFYALVAILLGSVIAWFMGKQISRRLYAVLETINAVRSGNHLARSSLAGVDEAAAMACEFNSMLDELAERDRELRASEEKYRSLIYKVQVAIVVHNGQGHILTSNPLARHLLGLTEDQLLGKALIDPDWHFLREDGFVMQVAEYPVSLVRSSRRPIRGYVTGISYPGRNDVVWVLVNAEPEYDESGVIERVIVSFIDITERKRVEDKLHRLNRELRAISNCNQVLIRATEEQTLLDDICRIICDEVGYHMAWIGYPENDETKTVRPVAWAGVEDGYLTVAGITWADTERGCGPVGAAIRSGESACIQDFATDPQASPWRENALLRGYRSCIALPLKDKNGNTFGVLCIYSTTPDVFSPDEIRLLEELAGDLAFGVSVLRDRIVRKRAEESFRESEQRYRLVFENSPVSIWEEDFSGVKAFFDNLKKEGISDIESYFTQYPETVRQCAESVRIIDVNRAALVLHAAATKEELLAGLVNTFTAESLETFSQELVCLWYGGTEMTRDAVVKTLAGELRQVTVYFSVCPGYEGTLSKTLISLVDISDRKLAEEKIRHLNQDLEQRILDRTVQLEATNKELEAFAYSVSHDLRAPLRHIGGFVDLLEKKVGATLDEKGHHYMGAISGATRKMGVLIDDLLSFSRMGRQAMSYQQVELSPLVHEVIAELTPDTAGRSIDWCIGDLPTATGDAAMLRRVLVNLISNAVKFTRPRLQAQIDIGSLPDQAAETVIFVKDNGVGFDMTYVDKLFGVFQRLHRAEEFEGTGIGLANVRRFITRHGGRVWAEGKLDQGATFYFSLPQPVKGIAINNEPV